MVFFGLCRELRTDPKLIRDEKNSLKSALGNYYYAAKDLVENASADPMQGVVKEIGILTQARDRLITDRESFLIKKEHKLNSVIYGDMNIEKIKKLYNQSDLKCED